MSPAILVALLIPGAVASALVRATGPRSVTEGRLVSAAWFAGQDEAARRSISWLVQPPGAALQLRLLRWCFAPFTGGPDTVVAARTAMTAVTVAGIALVWLVARRLGLAGWVAGLAAALLGLAPFAVALHRDATPANLAIPWALAGVALILGPTARPTSRSTARPTTAPALPATSRVEGRRTWSTAVGTGFVVVAVATGLLTDVVVVLVPIAALAVAAGVAWMAARLPFEAGLIAAAIVIVAVVVPIAVAAGDRATDTRAHDAATATSTWLATNLPAGTRVVTDDATAADLGQAGRPPRDLVWFGSPEGTDTRRGGYLVATPVVRSEADGDVAVHDLLAASEPIAVFGHGDERIEIRAVASDGVDARRAHLESDRAASARAGAALATNPAIGVSAPIRRTLADGDVDLRLLTAMATLAPDRPIALVALPIDDAEQVAGVPVRTAVLAVPTGREGAVLDFLRHQEDRFRPASVVAQLAPQPDTTWVRVTYPPL